MKNLKMRTKLLVGFSVVVLLSAVIGITGIVEIHDLSGQVSLVNTVGENSLGTQKLITNLETQRSLYRDAALRLAVGMPEGMEDELIKIEELDAAARAMITDFGTSFTQESSRQVLKDIHTTYEAFSASRDILLANLRGREAMDVLIANIGAAAADAADVMTDLSELTAFASKFTDDVADASDIQAVSSTWTMIILLIVAIAISLVSALYISSLISKPTLQLVNAANKLTTGDIDVDLRMDQKDEMGQLANAFMAMANDIQLQAHILDQIAKGDFTVDIPVRSDMDVMNKAINQMIASDNAVMTKLRSSAEQIDSGAAQISQASQLLASGSCEQAATLEEFTASVSQISHNAEENAQAASKALLDNQQSELMIRESIEAMEHMVEAMKTIHNSSQDISKIIGVIDDIAFQTNILSLNAAVEAARAGSHGKGFGVVADEVRNLARKSAAAAQETAALIETSTENVSIGNTIVSQVESCLRNIVEYSKMNAQMMEEIDRSSRDQSMALAEITSGINQIAEVVQSNSATAEETAASSEEMAAQSVVLKEILAQFKMKGDERGEIPHLTEVMSIPGKPQSQDDSPPMWAQQPFSQRHLNTGLSLIKTSKSPLSY